MFWNVASPPGMMRNIWILKVQVAIKGKGSSLDIAPLTILDSVAFQPWKWQLTGTDCSTAAQASGCPQPALTDYWAHSMQPPGILRPNQPR